MVDRSPTDEIALRADDPPGDFYPDGAKPLVGIIVVDCDLSDRSQDSTNQLVPSVFPMAQERSFDLPVLCRNQAMTRTSVPTRNKMNPRRRLEGL
jgi:hypothetical protein